MLGFVQEGGLLGWLKVLNAGHMAAMNQPQLIHYILATLEVASGRRARDERTTFGTCSAT